MKRKNMAISETIGTILLLGISVTLFSIIYFSVLTISPSPISPTANLICSLENDNLIIEHYGGNTLSLDTIVKLMINNKNNIITINDYMNEESKENGVWNIGERVFYHIEINDENISFHNNSVDSNSCNVEGSADKGTETNFANCQGTIPDSNVMTLQETTYDNSVHDNSVDSNSCNVDGSADKGTETNFSYCQGTTRDSNVMTLLETISNDIIIHNDSVDSNSCNVDGSVDKGTETNFANCQETIIDTDVMTIQEVNYGVTSVEEWLTITSRDTMYQEWDFRVGTSPYINTQDDGETHTGNHIREEKSSNVRDGWFIFSNTTASGSGFTVNFTFRMDSDDGDGIDGVWIQYDTTGSGAGSQSSFAGATSTSYAVYTITLSGTYTATEINNMRIYFKFYGNDDIYIDYCRMGISRAETTNYQVDLEYQWATAFYGDANEQLCFYIATRTGTEPLNINYRNGGSWTYLGSITGTGWVNITTTGLAGSTFTIQLIGATETGDSVQDSWSIDCMFLHTYNNSNCQIDFEYQWTTAIYDDTYEQLCFYIASRTGTEALNINYRNGGSWTKLGSITGTGWVNVSATGLTSSTYTIQLIGATETGDSAQDSWSIDCMFLNTYNNSNVQDQNISVYVIDSQSNSVIMMTNLKG